MVPEFFGNLGYLGVDLHGIGSSNGLSPNPVTGGPGREGLAGILVFYRGGVGPLVILYHEDHRRS